MSLPKKIFIGSTAGFVAILVFWGIYTLSFKKPSSAPAEKEVQTQSQEEKTNSKPLSAITKEKVLSAVFDSQSNTIKYYAKESGRAYEISLDGLTRKTISGKELTELQEVIWSPDRTKTITKFASQNGSSKFFLHDFTAESSIELKPNLDNVSWENNNKIAYKYFNPQTKERTLNIADPSGNNWTKIANIEFPDMFLKAVPQSSLLSFWNKGDAMNETNLFTIPSLGGEKKLVFKEKFGADYLWSPDGNNFLVSHSASKGGDKIHLAKADNKGMGYKNLGIPTFVSKCVWSKDNKTVYYALPGGIPNNVVLPNDYFSGKITTTDTFWKVDTLSGKKERILELNETTEKIDASELFLNTNESFLFLTNKLDGMLYRIKL